MNDNHKPKRVTIKHYAGSLANIERQLNEWTDQGYDVISVAMAARSDQFMITLQR